MATTNLAPHSAIRLLRFDRVQLVTHWTNATLFGLLIATAIPLYFGSFFGVIVPRHVIQMVHLWTGLALPLPVLVSLVGPWGRQMRQDVRRVNYWTRDEVLRVKSFGKTALAADKFNPGQKLNAIFIGGTTVVLLATGSLLQWFRFFPITWRAGATFVHDSFALAVSIVIIGHIVMAVTHRDALKAIFTGRVNEQWAQRHAPGWLAERPPTHSTKSD